MAVRLPRRGDVLRFSMLAGGAAALVAGARYFGAARSNAAERLVDSLLHTDKLRDATRDPATASEQRLAACAAYMLGVAYGAASGLFLTPNEDPIGYSRSAVHPYTRAAATVLTEAHSPEQVLTYAVTVPDAGEVRGTRRVGAVHMAGLAPARPAPDVAQIAFEDGYTAQMETEFEVAEYLTVKTRVFGAATLRDNRGNVGRLNVAYDGSIAGTITRDARVIGRFEGTVAKGLEFRQYQIEP